VKGLIDIGDSTTIFNTDCISILTDRVKDISLALLANLNIIQSLPLVNFQLFERLDYLRMIVAGMANLGLKIQISVYLSLFMSVETLNLTLLDTPRHICIEFIPISSQLQDYNTTGVIVVAGGSISYGDSKQNSLYDTRSYLNGSSIDNRLVK